MKITVTKYNPAVDAAPYVVSGDIEYHENMTALEALVAFHEQIEPVNFDYSCSCRLCGRCAMMVDGVASLACVTPIEDSNHDFAPLEGFPVIRDLVVDKSALDAKLSGIFDRVRIEDFNRQTLIASDYDPSIRQDLYALEFCCRCGVCEAACPVHQMNPAEYIGPTAMLAIAYRHLDPLDQGDRVMEAVNGGLFKCIQCGKCDEVCSQQDISHAKMWTMLRDAAQKRGIVPSYAKA